MSSPPSDPARPPAWTGAGGYARADEWLLGLELFGMDFGTDRMRRLLERLGNPQSSFRAIHVVGSNGKSSTARIADALVRAQGLRSGAYLSPHLASWSERVLVDGRPVDEGAFCAAAQLVAGAAGEVDASGEGGPVTQFEALTATGFVLLAESGVPAAVIEAGLGGRLDATNVIDAPVQACVSVGLEHTRWLGESVREIAAEKLAVTGPGSTLVVPADLDPEALAVAVARTGEVGARLVVAPAASPLAPAGTPPYLSHNLAVAAAAVHAFAGALDEAAVSRAVQDGALGIAGRFEVAGAHPLTIFDGAHNPDGMAALAKALAAAGCSRPVVACVSILDDKDSAAMLATLAGAVDRLVLTSCSHPRALDPGFLAKGLEGAPELEPDPHRALELARELAGPKGTAIATGSLYLIADLGRPPGAGGGSTL